MRRIATLTVNPTIDTSTSVGSVVPERKLRCAAPRRDPGGGGINVSRAIRQLGGTSTALYAAGGPTGEILRRLLDAEGVTALMVPIEGWTRENMIVYEESSGQQYRFGVPGPEIQPDECQSLLDELSALTPRPEFIVASGSLAPGVPDDFYGRVAVVAREMGARLVVDTSGTPLRRTLETGAYLLKPNIAELEDLVGEELSTEAAQEAAARRLIRDGACRVLVLSLGAGGALLITAEGSAFLRTPTVPIRSKVGAGDSMVAGMVLGLAREMDLLAAARLGVAAGAAAVMTEGTELCRRADAEGLYERMSTGSDERWGALATPAA